MKRLDYTEIDRLLDKGKLTLGEIAKKVGHSKSAVGKRSYARGLDRKKTGRPRKHVEHRERCGSYLADLEKMKRGNTSRPLENLSSVGGQLGCEVYTRCNSVGRGAAE